MALSGFQGGALQCLEQLDKINSYNTDKEGKEIAEEMILLRKQIKRLHEKRQQLLGQRRGQKQKILCDVFLEKPIPDTPMMTQSQEEKERLVDKENELKKLQALEAAYRLTGLSCETVKGDKKSNLLLRWDPSFQGHFMETFYAQIQMLPECKVAHHTLPVFVPMSDLEKSLKNSVTEFGMSVRKYLQAFVARRHIALKLKESIPARNLETEVHTTAAANCIQLELCDLRPPLPSVMILLIFDDLTRFHVTRVHVKDRGSATEEGQIEIDQLKEKLLNEDIIECVTNFLDKMSS